MASGKGSSFGGRGKEKASSKGVVPLGKGKGGALEKGSPMSIRTTEMPWETFADVGAMDLRYCLKYLAFWGGTRAWGLSRDVALSPIEDVVRDEEWTLFVLKLFLMCLRVVSLERYSVAILFVVFLIYPIGQGSFYDGMPLGISGAWLVVGIWFLALGINTMAFNLNGFNFNQSVVDSQGGVINMRYHQPLTLVWKLCMSVMLRNFPLDLALC
ncbi:hypothetical protein IFM89_037930 [Coptis chinensis]|uniref:Uncharacterized protein n=1 Tax=Coptis chinensis TaxID=261450 RepID=A0A835HQ90_9MAGN|nr:hypothetical protein IFM89_037930 [Coptis chinensis]